MKLLSIGGGDISFIFLYIIFKASFVPLVVVGIILYIIWKFIFRAQYGHPEQKKEETLIPHKDKTSQT